MISGPFSAAAAFCWGCCYHLLHYPDQKKKLAPPHLFLLPCLRLPAVGILSPSALISVVSDNRLNLKKGAVFLWKEQQSSLERPSLVLQLLTSHHLDHHYKSSSK